MGIMSIIDSLASTPVAKMAGGYMEGKIDKRKEDARIQEKKDDQYADLVNGFAQNMLTINASTLAEIAAEEQAWEEGKAWAVQQFGEGGLAMADKMRQDGAFANAKSWNEVFPKLQSMYEINEGELWYDNENWINFANQNKGWKLDENYYANKKDNIYNQVNEVFSNFNNGGDKTFELLTGFNTGKQPVGSPTSISAAPGEQAVISEGQGEAPDTSIQFKGEVPKKQFQKQIQGFSDTAFAKNISEIMQRAYPESDKLFTVDQMTAEMTLNPNIFADDPEKRNNINKGVDFINNVLAESRAAYQSGQIQKADNKYNNLAQFFNVKDFDERGFVQTVMDDYLLVNETLENNLVKNNLLLADFSDLLDTGVISLDDISDISDNLDNVFGSDWHTMYLNNIGLEDSTFKRAFDTTINDFINKKYDEAGAGRRPTKEYYTGMKFINSEREISKEEAKKGQGIEGDNYLEWFKSVNTSVLDGDFGVTRFSTVLSEIAPTDYAELQNMKRELGLDTDESLTDFTMITPERADEVVDFNIENTVKFKTDRMDGSPIEGAPVVAATVLRNKDIQTGADILNLIEQYKGNPTQIAQAVVGFIMADIEAGLLPQMNSNEIMDLAFKVRDDIAEFASQSYNASSTDENITDEKVIDTETSTILKNIDNEQKKETKVIETEIKKVLNEDTPWILADGSFDENFDPSTLDGRTYERDTPRGRYQLDKQKHLQGEFLGNIGSAWNWLTGKEEIDSTEDKKNIKNIKNIK